MLPSPLIPDRFPDCSDPRLGEGKSNAARMYKSGVEQRREKETA